MQLIMRIFETKTRIF